MAIEITGVSFELIPQNSIVTVNGINVPEYNPPPGSPAWGPLHAEVQRVWQLYKSGDTEEARTKARALASDHERWGGGGRVLADICRNRIALADLRDAWEIDVGNWADRRRLYDGIEDTARFFNSASNKVQPASLTAACQALQALLDDFKTFGLPTLRERFDEHLAKLHKWWRMVTNRAQFQSVVDNFVDPRDEQLDVEGPVAYAWERPEGDDKRQRVAFMAKQRAALEKELQGLVDKWAKRAAAVAATAAAADASAAKAATPGIWDAPDPPSKGAAGSSSSSGNSSSGSGSGMRKAASQQAAIAAAAGLGLFHVASPLLTKAAWQELRHKAHGFLQKRLAAAGPEGSEARLEELLRLTRFPVAWLQADAAAGVATAVAAGAAARDAAVGWSGIPRPPPEIDFFRIVPLDVQELAQRARGQEESAAAAVGGAAAGYCVMAALPDGPDGQKQGDR